MAKSVMEDIIFFLHEQYVADPGIFVPVNSLYIHILRTYPQCTMSDFRGVLKILIDERFVEQDVASYRLSGLGEQHALDLLKPPPPTHTPVDHSRDGGYATCSIIIGIVSLFVAIFGTPLAIDWANLKKTPQPHSTLVASGNSVAIMLDSAMGANGEAVLSQPLRSWFDRTPEISVPVNGVIYWVNGDTPVIETESQGSSNSPSIYVALNQRNVGRLHLLLNLSYTAVPPMSGAALQGITIGRVVLSLSDGSTATYDLKAGQNVREWVVGGANALNTLQEGRPPVWDAHFRSTGTRAVIDDVVLVLPESFRSGTLTQLTIFDDSQSAVNSRNPGLMLFGVTVELAD